METTLIGFFGAAILAVLGWTANAAIGKKDVFWELAPAIAATFGLIAMFGAGYVLGQNTSTPMVGWATLAGGGFGLFAMDVIKRIADR